MTPRLPRFSQSQSVSLHVAVLAVLSAASLGGGLAMMLPAADGPRPTGVAAPSAPKVDLAAAQHLGFRRESLRPDGAAVSTEEVVIKPGDTFASALERLGAAPADVAAALKTLSAEMDVVNVRAGMHFKAAVARAASGPAELVGLALRTGPVRAVSVARDSGGGYRLRAFEEKVEEGTTVAAGPINGSLYESATQAGADARLVSAATKLFAHKVDFSRDLHPDDHFKLVFDRKVTESGRTVETGDLMFAELEAKGRTTRFYRFRHDGQTQYFDEFGKNIKGFLLKTPVEVARVTSSFGMRFHPVLGYNRMHQGVDFGAPTGTPVFAAGEGVVEEVKWANGYGHWLKIRHTGGWATGYGHLSAYARGLRVGQRVAQGQLVAYVGATGIATGPHLHYEVMNNNKKLDPKSARVPSGTVLGGRELTAFKAEKAHIEALIAGAAQRDAARAHGTLTTARAEGAVFSGGGL